MNRMYRLDSPQAHGTGRRSDCTRMMKARRLPGYLLLSLLIATLFLLPFGQTGHPFAARPAARAGRGRGAPFQAGGSGDAVKLAQPEGTFPAGTVIPVTRCNNSFVGTGADCPYPHLHAIESIGSITICGQGPFPDPHANGCGFGPIVPFEADVSFASGVYIDVSAPNDHVIL